MSMRGASAQSQDTCVCNRRPSHIVCMCASSAQMRATSILITGQPIAIRDGQWIADMDHSCNRDGLIARTAWTAWTAWTASTASLQLSTGHSCMCGLSTRKIRYLLQIISYTTFSNKFIILYLSDNRKIIIFIRYDRHGGLLHSLIKTISEKKVKPLYGFPQL